MSAPSNGHGSFTFADGTKYTGHWKNSKPHGRGMMECSNCDIYAGNFSNGKAEGAGVFRFANGDIYEGNFMHGARDGTGVCRWASGHIYDGGWKNDMKEGRGVSSFAVDGKIPDEDGGWSYNSKDKFDGVFKADKRHGACIYTFFNGETFRCTFVEGRCAEFDQRQAAVRAAPDAASVQARAEGFASAQAKAAAQAKYTRTIDILQRLDLHAHIPAFMSAPAATHLPPFICALVRVVTRVAGKRTSPTTCWPP